MTKAPFNIKDFIFLVNFVAQFLKKIYYKYHGKSNGVVA
jgi:hypothetical protein